MKRNELNELVFEKAINGVKSALSKDEARPIFTHIHLIVKDGRANFYALDGFRASKYSTEVVADEEFKAYIPYFKFKATKRGVERVSISVEENQTVVKFTSELGVTIYAFGIPKDIGNIDIERIFEDARQHDRELSFNANMVASALKSISAVSLDRYRQAIIETKANNNEAFIIKADMSSTTDTFEYLILPIRNEKLKNSKPINIKDVINLILSCKDSLEANEIAFYGLIDTLKEKFGG